MNMAEALEIDAVIDPACTRDWIVKVCEYARAEDADRGQRRFIDPW